MPLQLLRLYVGLSPPLTAPRALCSYDATRPAVGPRPPMRANPHAVSAASALRWIVAAFLPIPRRDLCPSSTISVRSDLLPLSTARCFRCFGPSSLVLAPRPSCAMRCERFTPIPGTDHYLSIHIISTDVYTLLKLRSSLPLSQPSRTLAHFLAIAIRPDLLPLCEL